jgi:hypothetical protein
VNMPLRGTVEQQLIHLNMHWGRQYDFAAPRSPEGKWTAKAQFGGHDELAEESATDLLHAVRAHYSANRPVSP